MSGLPCLVVVRHTKQMEYEFDRSHWWGSCWVLWEQRRRTANCPQLEMGSGAKERSLERVPPELGLRAVDVCQEVGDGGWQAPQRGTGPSCYIYVDLSDRASQCLR